MFFSTTTQVSTDVTQHEILKDGVPAACNVSFRPLLSLCSVGPRDALKYFLEHTALRYTELRTGNTSLGMEQNEQIGFSSIYMQKYDKSTWSSTEAAPYRTHLSQAPAVPAVLPKGPALPACPGTVLSGEDASPNCDTRPIHFRRRGTNGIRQSNGFRPISQLAQLTN